MSYNAADIAARLQEARKAKGLSQRALSELTGVPQAQISRIEAGTVDLRLSSLVALAHAIDLELTLVPRKAMPAVRSLSRDAVSVNRKDIVTAQKEIQRIRETMRGLQIEMPNLEGLQQLQKSFSDLQRFPVPTLDLSGLKQLRQAMEKISRPAQEMAALSQSIKLIQAVRNKAAHGPLPDADDTLSRPAYSLDDEDEDV